MLGEQRNEDTSGAIAYFCCRARLEIKVDAEAIGAIGVGGAPGGDLDEACAKAGLDKISGRLK